MINQSAGPTIPNSLTIVGIGASAGGLEAFQEFLSALPEKTGMAFILVQHLEPHHRSELAAILARSVKMPVVQAEEGQRVEADHIYVIPPNVTMTIRQSVLHLEPRGQSNKPHYPVDQFFASLAGDQGSNAVGIVLSGSASDGTEGLRAIKNNYGTTYSQDEASAKFGGMPHSAIATGVVDLVLPPAEIARHLATLRVNPLVTFTPEEAPPERPLADDQALRRIFELLRRKTRVDFSQYKQNTIHRRIGRRMVVHQASTLAEYQAFLEDHSDEVLALHRELLISVTSFFREPEMFEALAEALRPYILARPVGEPFRIWVPGCATGEEVYTLAITVTELLEQVGRDTPVQVFGTDISEGAIVRARSGTYPESIEQNVSPERLLRFFARVDGSYRVKQTLRDSCIFANHDLTAETPFSQMDVVSCRNLMIYLESKVQQRIMPALHYSLKPGGFLVLGSAETIGTRNDLFGVVNSEQRLFYKKEARLSFTSEFTFTSGPDRGMAMSEMKPVALASVRGDLEARGARMLRDLYAPPGVIINADLQVLHFHGQTQFFLQTSPGEASLNLLRLARESLIFPLRKVVSAAIERNQAVHESGVRVEFGGAVRTIALHVLPLSAGPDICYLVLFENQLSQDSPLAAAQDVPLAEGQALAAWELQLSQARGELAQMRDYLRTMIEQYEASAEELKSANEEARSANEELQSTNEELRTAKEEMQSTNEELVTVNAELKHRNKDLTTETNDLSNVLNAVNIPVVMVDRELRVRSFTPAAERVLDLTRGDLGRTFAEIRAGFDLPNLKGLLMQVIQTLSVEERRVQDRSGRWHSLAIRPYRTVDDRIEGAVLSLIYIDEATRALQEAQRARAFAEAMLETVQHPLLLLDSELRIVRATSSFYQMFQVSAEESEGKLLYAIGSGQWNLAELRAHLQEALTRDVAFHDLEVEQEFPKIGRRTMRLNGRRLVQLDHTPATVLLAIDDVTERKEAAEIHYRRLFESAKDAILVLDANSGRVIDSNPYFTELTRYSARDVLDLPFWELPPFLASEEAHRLLPAARLRDTVRFDAVRMEARDGRRVIVDILANRYDVKDRSFIQLNIRDVTEKHRSDEAMRRSNLDLQQFAFAASHDLQEPLRTVTTYLQLFKKRFAHEVDEDARQYIAYITAAAERMRQMVLDLLGYSQIARADVAFEQQNVGAVLSTTLLNLQMAVRDTNASITFDSLPVVMADGTQLLQLLQNLIGNAIKYRSSEPPQIHIGAKQVGNEWVFSVKDNGVGLDPKHAEHIFTVFKRLHGAEYPGTGIGLAICKRVVERHGGRIWVESRPDEGATFYFTLPVREQSL
ncbi:MAG: chemotaxis protein CheB [Candidatus Solibacter sp.]